MTQPDIPPATGGSAAGAAAFDLPESQVINVARKDFVERSIDEMRASGRDLKTAIDVGCGFGYFTASLLGKGLEVMATDVRPENVAETRRRNPTVKAAVYNVEDARIADMGKADLVLCLGLLYHLENPMQAIRNLRGLTRDVLIAESVCAPGSEALAMLYAEDVDIDQGLNYVALIPTEAWLVNAFTLAGFRNVYRAVRMPDHPDFRASMSKRRRRTVLVATDEPLAVRDLEPVAPRRLRQHLWDRFSFAPVTESPQVRAAVRSVMHRTRGGSSN